MSSGTLAQPVPGPGSAAVPPGARRSGGPLQRVLQALQDGAGSRQALGERTGLDGDVVDSALAHLVRLGRVSAEQLGSGCPSDGCRACPSGGSSGLPTCLTGSATQSRKLVAIRLVTQPPE